MLIPILVKSFLCKRGIKNKITILEKSKGNDLPKYKARTPNQKMYEETLKSKYIDLVFCIGPAGTGKTLFACKYAIEELMKNEFNKIVITRPTISIQENLGFLPGNIFQKMNPFTVPIFDTFKEMILKKNIDDMMKENSIEIVPLGFMQGRTFKNTIIIADEMQNSTPDQMFMLLTRLGENSKLIITGDPMQSVNDGNGLEDITNKMNKYYENREQMNKDGIDIIYLENIDIQRSKIVSTIEKIYNNNMDNENTDFCYSDDIDNNFDTFQ